jgi:hypothetical protein
MKKFTLLLILALGFTYVNSQWAVTLYKNRDFLKFNSTNDQITVMEMDRQGNLWFNLSNTQGGAGMGKFIVEKKEWVIFNIGTDLINKELGLNVNAFAFDLADSIWVGTDNGLAKFDGKSPEGWKVYNSKNSPIPDNKITALAVNNNNIIWIGFSNGNLASFNGYNWIIFDKYSGTGNVINDLEIDIDGNIWIARNGTPGLVKFNGEFFTEFSKLTDIRNIMVDGKGLVHVVSKDKLVIIQNNEVIDSVQPDPRLECELYKVAYHPEGPFVSSNKGIFQKIGSAFKLYSNVNSALPELVPPVNYNPIPLIYDGGDGLWFSFIYQGITGTSYASIGHMVKIVITPIPIPIPDKPLYRFCYGESITLDAVVDADNYVWDGLKTKNRTYTVFDTKTIELAVILKENCLMDTLTTCVESNQITSSTVTVDVIAQHVFKDEKPCVATVTPENKNLVVWERTFEVGTASYNVYKANDTTDLFEFLGNIPADQLSVFEDNLSDPSKGSVYYKIASVDTCGNESGPSYYHKTMYLQFSYGADTTETVLTWNPYMGFSFSDYIIYKGTSPDNLYPVDSIPYINTPTWTDYNVIGNYYYCIGVRLQTPCAPARDQGKKAGTGPYSQSMSNIEDNRLKTSIDEKGITEILSYPNPFTYWTQIDFENPTKYPYQLKVTDISGKIVRMVNGIRDNKVILLRDNLPQGFYLFELKGDNVYKGKFVVR